MSTNPLERIPKHSPQTSVTDLNEFAKTAGSTAASAAYPIMLGLTGEDTGDKWYEDLAYGAVPGGALVQRAKTGTMPGLLDMLPGDLGAGARLAMLPIAKFGAEEIAKGAARMGKSGRNVTKAMEKKFSDSPYTFYHRTHAGDVENIKKEGLKLNNDNYGRNTGDSNDLPPVNWLSPSPSAIPVLRYPLEHDPESVAQFKVTIPRDVYHNTPKFVMPEGRGSGRAVPVPKGELGITNEGPYKILMYGDNIPPENLEQMSMKDMIKNVKDEAALEDFLNTIAEGYGLEDSYTLSKILHENPQLEKRVERIADEEYGDIDIKGIDRPLVHELNGLTLPISERLVNGTKFIDEGLDRANRRITELNDGHHNFEEGATPYSILQDELRRVQVQAGMDDNGDIVKKKYWKPESKVSDLLVMKVAPMREPDVFETIPGPGKISKGSVSRGLEIDGRPPESRHFNTELFKSLTEQGSTPYEAAVKSSPTSRLNPNLENIDEPMYMSWFPWFSKGAISRGIDAPRNGEHPIQSIQDIYRSLDDFTPKDRKEFVREVMKNRSELGD